MSEIRLDGTKPCPDCRRVLTTEPKCHYCTERDQLRAELAAAKERGDGLYLGLRQTLEALGGVAQPGVSEAFLILGVPGEAAAIKRVNTALAAHVERLVGALSGISDRLTETSWRRDCDHIRCTCDEIGCNGAKFRAIEELLQTALAATPAQSLAAHDAAVKVAVLREVARVVVEFLSGIAMRPETSYERGFVAGVVSAKDHSGRIMLAEADRIAKEAGRG